MVERFFRGITTERLRRCVFTSVPEPVTAIGAYIAHHNIQPKPFIWTKSKRDILQKVIRANNHLCSKQNAAHVLVCRQRLATLKTIWIGGMPCHAAAQD